MSDHQAATHDESAADESEGGAGLNGPTRVPDESVESESDLALDNLDARREPEKKQGDS